MLCVHRCSWIWCFCSLLSSPFFTWWCLSSLFRCFCCCELVQVRDLFHCFMLMSSHLVGPSHLVGRIMGKLLPNMINSPSCTSTKQPIYVCFIWIYVLLYDLYNIYVASNLTQTKVDKLTQSLYEWPVEMSCFRFPSKSFHRLFQITVSYVPQFFYLLQIEWSILDPMTGPGRSTDWISMMGIWINLSTPFGLNMRIYNLEPKAPLRCLRIVSRKGTTLPTNEFFKCALIDFQLS